MVVGPEIIYDIKTRADFIKIEPQVRNALSNVKIGELDMDIPEFSKPIYNIKDDMIRTVTEEYKKVRKKLLCNDQKTLRNQPFNEIINQLNTFKYEYLYYVSKYLLGSSFYSFIKDYEYVLNQCSKYNKKIAYPCPDDVKRQSVMDFANKFKPDAQRAIYREYRINWI